MSDLLAKKCIPCSIGAPTLTEEEIEELLPSLKEGWELLEDDKLEKNYKFKDFVEALDFVNKIGDLAEQEGHHPDIFLSWGQVIVQLWTHKIDGLHENDFILAAKIDELPQN